MMNNNRLNMVIPMSILYDIDIGIIRYIKSYWDLSDNYFFNDNIFIEDEDEIKKLLLSRTELNPLYPFFKDEILSDDNTIINTKEEYMDYLLESLIEESYEDIFELSEPTDYIRALKLIKSTKGVNINIITRFDYERDVIINTLGSNINFIDDIDNIDTSIYNVIFLKYVDNLNNINISNTDPFHLYLPDYRFNIDIDDTNKDISINLSRINKNNIIFTHNVMNDVKIIQLYTNISNEVYGGLLNENK